MLVTQADFVIVLRKANLTIRDLNSFIYEIR